MRWAEQNCMISTRCRRAHDTQSTKTHQSFFSLQPASVLKCFPCSFCLYLFHYQIHLTYLFSLLLSCSFYEFLISLRLFLSQLHQKIDTGLSVCRFIIKFSHKCMHVHAHTVQIHAATLQAQVFLCPGEIKSRVWNHVSLSALLCSSSCTQLISAALSTLVHKMTELIVTPDINHSSPQHVSESTCAHAKL